MGDDLTRVDSHQYPSAHLGHLTKGQENALDKFKKICEASGYYWADGHNGRKYASHDDETLLRYLRARKFNPDEAFKQFKDTEDWRKGIHLEELYDTIDVTEYEETRRLYPQWTGRRDRRGIPVYVFEVAHLNSKTINAYQNSVAKNPTVNHDSNKVPTKMLRLFALYENLTRFVMPLCTAVKDRPHPETPISQSSNIVDISKVGLKQFWNLKGHMQDASQLATAHYPETLDRIFIIGAPAFFPTVWGWIKRWFDPITVSKIFILSNSNMKSVLEMYIEPENIPKKYGGKLDFEFGNMPNLEPAIADSMELLDTELIQTAKEGGVRSVPTGPIKWREGVGKEMEAIAVGSEDGKPRERLIARVHTDHQGMYGVDRHENTPIDWALEQVVSTPGTATQPTEEGDLYFGSDLDSGTATPVPAPNNQNGGSAASSPKQEPHLNSNTTPSSNEMATIISNDTASVPAEPHPTVEGEPVSSSQPRKGTSDTRAAATDVTHASGQPHVQENTPHVVSYGHGEKATTIEPSTVGQAPKDPFANIPDPEETPQAGIVDLTKEVADQAYSAVAGAASSVVSAVAGAVGGSNSEPEEKKEPVPEPAQDGRVDKAEDRNVEEYLRSQYPSQNATSEANAK